MHVRVRTYVCMSVHACRETGLQRSCIFVGAKHSIIEENRIESLKRFEQVHCPKKYEKSLREDIYVPSTRAVNLI